MVAEEQLSQPELLECLSQLATASLTLWALPQGATARLINISENATFVIEASSGFRSILRVHRQDYHTRNAIACELAWMQDLGVNGGVITPSTMAGRNREVIQESSIYGLPGKRYLVMFEFVEGVEPDATDDLVARFEELGEIAALTHIHSLAWQRPDNFERLVWNLETVYGLRPTWGDWRNAPAMNSSAKSIMQSLEDTVTRRLKNYGMAQDRYGLIHADMRLANLLVLQGSTRLIDFDDCGSGWYMYDFAAGISFMEDHPQVPALQVAWIKGYRKVRVLTAEDEHEMQSFVMLRRMALCAWIGSHSEVDIAQELSPVFVPITVSLAEEYLETYG